MAKLKLDGVFARADTNSFKPRLVVLATEAADQAALLAVMVQAYTALEKIVTHDQDSLERSATRASLGSLMRALNREMGRQAEMLVFNTAALCTFATENSIEQ